MLALSGAVLAESSETSQTESSVEIVPYPLLDVLDARVMWSSPSLDLLQMKEQTTNPLLSSKTKNYYTRWYNRYSAWLNMD